MIDVILIQPPVAFNKAVLGNDMVPNCPHLGLLYLEEGVKKAGLSVKILDLMDISYEIKDILKYIKENNTKIVGLTAMTMNIRGALQIAKAIKENLGDTCHVCLGGPHVSADPDFIKRFPYFDFAIRGEADMVFPRIASDIVSKKIDHKGLIEAEAPSNLDELPILRRESVDYDLCKRRNLYANHLMATRGCPFSCIFCSIPAMLRKFRKRSPKLVVEEIRGLYKLNNINHFTFCDDVFTLDRQYVLELCSEIANLDRKITWEAQTRASLVDDALLKAMSKTGCTKIIFGVESGSERIRNEVVNKKVTNEEIRTATKLCWKYNIEPDWYLMLGFPTEMREELMETVNFPIKCAPGPNVIGVHITMPLPGSQIFNSMVENKEMDRSIIDDFATGKLGDGYKDFWPYYIPKGMTIAELKEFRLLAYRKFYFRISYLIRKLLRDIFSLKKLKEDIDQATALFLYGRSTDDK